MVTNKQIVGGFYFLRKPDSFQERWGVQVCTSWDCEIRTTSFDLFVN